MRTYLVCLDRLRDKPSAMDVEDEQVTGGSGVGGTPSKCAFDFLQPEKGGGGGKNDMNTD